MMQQMTNIENTNGKIGSEHLNRADDKRAEREVSNLEESCEGHKHMNRTGRKSKKYHLIRKPRKQVKKRQP